MESTKHNKTLKRPITELATEPSTNTVVTEQAGGDHLRNLLDTSAKEAFARPWHRLERGLRLNRLRMYGEEMAPQCSFTADEKSRFFAFLSNALDRKLLNTHKIVDYDLDAQKIKSIRGLEVRRISDGTIKWGFTRVKKADGTRRRRATSVGGSVTVPQSDKLEEVVPPVTKLA
uniref:Uncharacterized protein n=1 Tax=viral metagenome TaxID=1070528 RepID=A0A6C0DJH2_9ZZZZ